MGKPDNNFATGQSVDELLSSIREAIEADSASMQPAADEPLSVVPRRHAPAPRAPKVTVTDETAPDAADDAGGPQPPQPRDVKRGPGYLSKNPYRYRYANGTSTTFMSLKNRLASLNAKAKADTGRSLAGLLGGDVRSAEAQAQAAAHSSARSGNDNAVQQAPPATLRGSIGGASAEPVQLPNYDDWTLETALEPYMDDERSDTRVDMPASQDMQEASEPDPVDGSVEPEPEPEPASEAAADEAGLADDTVPLQQMVRQVLEPELSKWFDDHLPDHVARAMPDDEAFTAMIRPLIEEWLEDNLAEIVERAVKEEIARITGLRR